MGDFNAKVGGKVKYGDKEANKGEKELVKMCDESKCIGGKRGDLDQN